MMMIEVILFGYFLTCVCGDGVADVVLDCTLVEEGVGLGGTLFTRTPATLILRDITVAPDESLETLTPFVPPSIPDPDAILLEAKVSSPEIPDAHVLLHADCNEQEVMCELSRYTPGGSQESSEAAYFMVSLNVEGGEFSTALILQTLVVEKDQSTLIQNKLGLPLSHSGTLLTEVVFLVFSHITSVTATLRSDVLLNCGFKQQEIPVAQEVGVEWRLQHRGRGGKVLEMKTRLDEAEGSTVGEFCVNRCAEPLLVYPGTSGEGDFLQVLHAERAGSSMDASQVVSEGNASMTLTKLKVLDEGTYICTVSVGIFHAQQIIQLHVIQPPHVSLSEERLVLKTSPQTLSCHCTNYYPLDAQMEWLSLSPTDSEPTVLPDQGSLSSHRQHGDGTYSLSSHLTVSPSVSPGTEITCRVSHLALDAPLSVSLLVESPEAGSYWWVLGMMIVTVLFFYQVMR